MNLSRWSRSAPGFVYLEADLGAGPLAHPPYALYLTYVISAWTP
jgi:hypothetical protein